MRNAAFTVHEDGQGMTLHNVLATYTLQLIGPPGGLGMPVSLSEAFRFGAHLRETEENLTDLLPEGYSVRIREWDEEE